MELDARQHRIAEAAYYKAQQRGFASGGEMDDWLEAEREVNAADGPLAVMDDGTPVPTQTSGNAIPTPFDKEEELRREETQKSAEKLSKNSSGKGAREQRGSALR